jgi:hypothetical protein
MLDSTGPEQPSCRPPAIGIHRGPAERECADSHRHTPSAIPVSDASGGKRDAIAAPLVVRRRDQALPGALLLVIAFLWIAVAIYGYVASKLAVVPGFGIAGPYLAGTLGVALAILALDWMLRGQAVLVARGEVAVTSRSLFGRRTRREPLAGYREIRAYPERRTHPAGGSRSWYVVRLWHPEPAKAVELARAKDPARIERLAQDWARRLNLPLSSWRTRRAGRGHARRRATAADGTLGSKSSSQPRGRGLRAKRHPFG